MGRHSTDLSDLEDGRPSPLSDLSCSRRQSRLPDPQKKKKKKWREAELGPDPHLHAGVRAGNVLNRAAESGQGKRLGVTDNPGLWPLAMVTFVSRGIRKPVIYPPGCAPGAWLTTSALLYRYIV